MRSVCFVYSCVLRVAARLVADIEHEFAGGVAIHVVRKRFEHLIVEPVDSRDGSATGQAPHTCYLLYVQAAALSSLPLQSFLRTPIAESPTPLLTRPRASVTPA